MERSAGGRGVYIKPLLGCAGLPACSHAPEARSQLSQHHHTSRTPAPPPSAGTAGLDLKGTGRVASGSSPEPGATATDKEPAKRGSGASSKAQAWTTNPSCVLGEKTRASGAHGGQRSAGGLCCRAKCGDLDGQSRGCCSPSAAPCSSPGWRAASHQPLWWCGGG